MMDKLIIIMGVTPVSTTFE